MMSHILVIPSTEVVLLRERVYPSVRNDYPLRTIYRVLRYYMKNLLKIWDLRGQDAWDFHVFLVQAACQEIVADNIEQILTSTALWGTQGDLAKYRKLKELLDQTHKSIRPIARAPNVGKFLIPLHLRTDAEQFDQHMRCYLLSLCRAYWTVQVDRRAVFDHLISHGFITHYEAFTFLAASRIPVYPTLHPQTHTIFYANPPARSLQPATASQSSHPPPSSHPPQSSHPSQYSYPYASHPSYPSQPTGYPSQHPNVPNAHVTGMHGTPSRVQTASSQPQLPGRGSQISRPRALTDSAIAGASSSGGPSALALAPPVPSSRGRSNSDGTERTSSSTQQNSTRGSAQTSATSKALPTTFQFENYNSTTYPPAAHLLSSTKNRAGALSVAAPPPATAAAPSQDSLLMPPPTTIPQARSHHANAAKKRKGEELDVTSTGYTANVGGGAPQTSAKKSKTASTAPKTSTGNQPPHSTNAVASTSGSGSSTRSTNVDHTTAQQTPNLLLPSLPWAPSTSALATVGNNTSQSAFEAPSSVGYYPATAGPAITGPVFASSFDLLAFGAPSGESTRQAPVSLKPLKTASNAPKPYTRNQPHRSTNVRVTTSSDTNAAARTNATPSTSASGSSTTSTNANHLMQQNPSLLLPPLPPSISVLATSDSSGSAFEAPSSANHYPATAGPTIPGPVVASSFELLSFGASTSGSTESSGESTVPPGLGGNPDQTPVEFDTAALEALASLLDSGADWPSGNGGEIPDTQSPDLGDFEWMKYPELA